MGGFMPPQQVITERDEGLADDLRHVEILGRLILRTLHRMEKQMADQNLTITDILAAAQEQQGEVASMAVLLQKIHDRVNQLVAGQVDPSTQANINAAFAEIKGNTRALADSITTYTPDATAGQSAGTGTDPGTGGTTGPADTGAKTTTTLKTSNAVVNVGDKVTLSAGVSAATGVDKPITGTVTFATESESVGTATLDSTGVAAYSLDTSVAGDHSFTATYGGDANFASSTSDPVTQSIMPVPAPAPAPQA
jgi:uncharacterized coiled-coil protein SlyX